MGYHGGRCVIEPLRPSVVLPVGIALYTHPVDDTALLRQALEALEGADEIDCDMRDAITALRERLGETK
jgi:hypothetical protein